MRVACEKTLKAWQEGKAFKQEQSVWTDGRRIYSFQTVLLIRNGSGKLIANRTKYSKTTTRHLNAILRELGSSVIEVSGLPFGATEDDLIDAADLD